MRAIMKHFSIMRDDLLVASEHANSNFRMGNSQRFFNKTKNHAKWMHQMRVATKMMQASLRKLSNYRMDLDF